MLARLCRFFVVLWVGIFVLGGQEAWGVPTWSRQSKPFGGITIKEGRTANNKNDVYAAFITLCTNYVHPIATPAPTSFRTAGSWGTSAGVQLAVNGDFFKSGPSVYGDAVGSGKRWPASKTGVDDQGQWYYRDYGWIAFGKGWVEFSHTGLVKKQHATNGVREGWYPTAYTSKIPTGTRALVSGFPQLVIEGKQVKCSSPTASSCFPDRSDMRARHPRTAMGLTRDRRTFMLVVVDGRRSSSIGMYGSELAKLMYDLGAYVAFNLDGGGSSQMWLKGRGYVNRPSDGSARSVANHWGIFAGSSSGKAKTAGSCFVAGGCFPTPLPGTAGSRFQDMATSAFAYAEAVLLHQKGIDPGCQRSPGPMFCPTCAIPRRRLIGMVIRAAGISLANLPTTPTFSDVPANDPDFKVIEAANKAGITKGCGNGKFCPNRIITRAEAATFIVRARKWKQQSPSKPSYSDVPKDHLFYSPIETAKAACVLNACKSGAFCPDDTLTAARAAQFIVKAWNLDNKNSCLREVCDGKDNDLDGTIDEGDVCAKPEPDPPDAGPAPDTNKPPDTNNPTPDTSPQDTSPSDTNTSNDTNSSDADAIDTSGTDTGTTETAPDAASGPESAQDCLFVGSPQACTSNEPKASGEVVVLNPDRTNTDGSRCTNCQAQGCGCQLQPHELPPFLGLLLLLAFAILRPSRHKA